MKKTWLVAAVGCGLCVVGCFGQVADGGGGGGSGSPAPTPSGTSTPGQQTPVSPPNAPPVSPSDTTAGDSGVTPSACVSDSGTVCNLADGAVCLGNQECASGVCYGDAATSGHCSEECTPANEATVCNFGAHKCGSAGFCLSTCTGAVCNLPDGQACKGNQECASDICFANGNASGGSCSENCTAANAATVCNFGQHKCSDANNGLCL